MDVIKPPVKLAMRYKGGIICQHQGSYPTLFATKLMNINIPFAASLSSTFKSTSTINLSSKERQDRRFRP